MIQLMEALTEKPDWQRKIKDPKIVVRWRKEAMANIKYMSKSAFDWCMRELKDKAERLSEDKYLLTLDGVNAVLKSDHLITPELVAALKESSQHILDDEHPDWHPRSNDQVLNLIHPSLYPLVYGQTRILSQSSVPLERCWEWTGQGDIIPIPVIEKDSYRSDFDRAKETFSTRFQWLPCEVAFQDEGGVRITSYINNLPPTAENLPLYEAIEKAIALSMEPWNQILVRDKEDRLPFRIPCAHIDVEELPHEDGSFENWFFSDDSDDDEDDGYYGRSGSWREEKAEKVARRMWNEEPNNPLMEDIIEWQEGLSKDSTFDQALGRIGLAEALNLKARLTRKIPIPDAGESLSYEEWRNMTPRYTVDLAKEFHEKGLQVIVKMASIELTPEKPSYAGGSWHLEGLLNERIVATSILYYDVENVSPSRIEFRYEASQDHVLYPQYDHDPLTVIFGSEHGEKRVQDLGSVETKQGRLIAFPNTHQHRVESFELLDKTKSGHRRMLVLWLVDPHYRIASTRNVPPQQRDLLLVSLLTTLGPCFPAEVIHQIHDHLECGMDDGKAQAVRLHLMRERTQNLKGFLKKSHRYDFCEH